MNRVATPLSGTATEEWEKKLLVLRYKLAKVLNLVPARERQQASAFEDSNHRRRFYQSLWRRSADSLGYHYRELGYGFWAVSDRHGNEVRGKGGNLSLDTSVALQLAGNKALSHRLLQDTPGYRAPAFCEFRLSSIHKALAFMQQQGPCVVKPARDTGAGAGVITGIHSATALRRAAVTASIKCKDLLIEETIPGSSYRLLFLNGQFIHGVRRDSPHVVGDGKSTVRELIEAENSRRRQQGDTTLSLFLLDVDQECRATLAAQSLGLASRPDNGQKVMVKRVVNQNAAKENVEITDQVHPSILETGAKASTHLGLELSGVDVLTTDISRPLADTGGVINEINSTPGLHHHYLTAQKRDPEIAEKLLRYCMATASISQLV